MKSITFKSYGNPNILNIVEFEIPKPEDKEILVRVIANSLNKANI